MLTARCRIVEMLINSKNIIKYSKSSYFVLNAVFHSFSCLILIRLNASFRLSLINHYTLSILILKFVIKRSEYLFFCVSALIFQKFTHSLNSFDFLNVIKIDCSVLNLKCRIYSLIKLWSMYFLNIIDSSSFNLYIDSVFNFFEFVKMILWSSWVWIDKNNSSFDFFNTFWNLFNNCEILFVTINFFLILYFRMKKFKSLFSSINFLNMLSRWLSISIRIDVHSILEFHFVNQRIFR